jgi:hypothetical protein
MRSVPSWLVMWFVLTACAESPIDQTEFDASVGPATPGSDLDASSPMQDEPSFTVDAAFRNDASVADASWGGNPGQDGSASDPSSLDASAADAARDPVPNEAGVDAALRDAAVRDAAAPAPGERDAATARDAAVPSGPMCSAEQRACGASCVDVRSDVANCGSCGMRCAAGEMCAESRCMRPPPAGCTARTLANRRYLFCTTPLVWRDARMSCLGAGMDLAIIDNAAENELVRTIGATAWLGAGDSTMEGRYAAVVPGNAQRSDGAQLSYLNWSSGEPNNIAHCDGRAVGSLCFGDVRDEDCVQIIASGQWNDANCLESTQYVCEQY